MNANVKANQVAQIENSITTAQTEKANAERTVASPRFAHLAAVTATVVAELENFIAEQTAELNALNAS